MGKRTLILALVIVGVVVIARRPPSHRRERQLTEELGDLLVTRPYTLEILAGGASGPAFVKARTTFDPAVRPRLADWLDRARRPEGPSDSVLRLLEAAAPVFLQARGHGPATAVDGDTVRILLPVDVLDPDSVDRATRQFLDG